jgi:oxalate decarboxylase
MLYGTARITAIDADGKSFVADVGKNDLWFFPSGVPHSIQGLSPDGCEFMLVFDDGDFSESETVLLSDAMAHLGLDVLSKNFAVSEQAFANLPRQELFIFQTDVPGELEADQKAAAGALGKSSRDFAFRTMAGPPTKQTKGGEVRIVDSKNFKVTTTAMALVTVHPGGMRELHWHPNADEWQYYIAGKGRMTVVATGNKARTMDFQEGDVGYVQKTLLHNIENTGDTDLVFIEMFGKVERFQEFSFSEWLAHTPGELVMAHLKIDKATYDAIPKNGGVVMPLS